MTLSRQVIQSLIRQALREDLGAGDLTTTAIVPRAVRIRARVIAKTPGIVAGSKVARWVFEAVDRRIRCTITRHDGHLLRRGQTILTLHGPAQGILTAERTALNFLGHLSGVATLTNRFVQRVRPYPVKIMDTRKTLPGLRLLEKYAVRVGGGYNHRLGLDDAILIKTNHLRALSTKHAALSKSAIMKEVIHRAKQLQPRKPIEIEVMNLRGFRAALETKPHVIMLDNWRRSDIRRAVVFRNLSPSTHHPSPLLEVSGGVTLANVRAIARTGVDRISIGRLTHSAPTLDVSLVINPISRI